MKNPLLILVSVALAASQRVSYDGYKVYRVNVADDRDRAADVVSSLSDLLNLDVWKHSKAGLPDGKIAPPRPPPWRNPRRGRDQILQRSVAEP